MPKTKRAVRAKIKYALGWACRNPRGKMLYGAFTYRPRAVEFSKGWMEIVPCSIIIPLNTERKK